MVHNIWGECSLWADCYTIWLGMLWVYDGKVITFIVSGYNMTLPLCVKNMSGSPLDLIIPSIALIINKGQERIICNTILYYWTMQIYMKIRVCVHIKTWQDKSDTYWFITHPTNSASETSLSISSSHFGQRWLGK